MIADDVEKVVTIKTDDRIAQLEAENEEYKKRIAEMEAQGIPSRGIFVIPAGRVLDVTQPQGDWQMKVFGVPFLQALELSLNMARFCYQNHMRELFQAAERGAPSRLDTARQIIQ